MPRQLAVSLVAFGALSLAGCSSSHPGRPAAASISAPNSVAEDLAARAAAGTGRSLRATYDARATTGRRATVAVFLAGRDRFRVDVTEPGSTASLFGTPAGSVACTSRTGAKVSCFLVAGPGKPVPAKFDAGVQRVFNVDLPVLAVNAAAFSVRTGLELPATGTLAAARCFIVTSAPGGPPLTRDLAGQVDLGTYCLTAAGLPRSLTFASGGLSLTGVGGAPSPAQLRPPAAAKPLPGGAAG
jgi:hypothetical protein